MNQRHTEFFGPDFARGPFASSRTDIAALQIATALAQLRAPVTRSSAELLAHGDFIRQLADRLAPDYAAFISVDVGSEQANAIQTTIRTALSTFSLLDIWLADDYGGGITNTPPAGVSFNIGTPLEEVLSNRRYIVLTSATGVVDLTVSYSGTKHYRWGISRYGRVFYSLPLDFS